ncbi:MAG TPA: threonine synthase [Phycisphaerae bacterium]|nr:threonine synthase [Phycisphaerae bacterium]
MNDSAHQQCIDPDCAATYAIDEVLFACRNCGALLDVRYDWDRCHPPDKLSFFQQRWSSSGRDLEARADFSGVWRFRELLPFARVQDVFTIGEGRTLLQQADLLAADLGMKPGSLFLQYEGFNPSGSFKDNGMTAAFTMARMLDRRRVACASTGNTSASMALFASAGSPAGKPPIQAIVFIGSGKIAYGKLSQALDHAATTLQIAGDFDACMKRVAEITDRLGVYLMNSVNPFRLEGQKAIIFRVLEGLDWRVPDWIIVPGGNLGNTGAFGKALGELHQLGLIDRIPRLAVINATGANTLFDLHERQGVRWNEGRFDRPRVDAHYAQLDATHWKAKTIASAIEIGRPVNLSKALRSLSITNGLVRHVDDPTILDHKALVGRYGYSCEPASAASVAGLRALLAEQTISPDDLVVCILTGHGLKDPDATVGYHTGMDTKAVKWPEPKPPTGAHANRPIPVADDLEEICRVLDRTSDGGAP